MRFIKMFMFLLLSVFFIKPVHAVSNAEAYGSEFNFNHGQGFQKYQLGTKVIQDRVWDLKLQYNFAVDGGATGTVTLRRITTPGGGVAAASAKIPANAIVTHCMIDVLTAPTGTTASLAFSTGKSASDLKTATAIGSYTGLVACVPVGTAATAIKISTSDVTPVMVITGSSALTAGKINLHIQYILSD